MKAEEARRLKHLLAEAELDKAILTMCVLRLIGTRISTQEGQSRYGNQHGNKK
jgi:hypothetical protein